MSVDDDGDDNILSNSDNSSGLSDLKFGDPLFLHPNDTNPTPTTTISIFPGEDLPLSPATCRWGKPSPAKCRWGIFTGE
ncbi:hypothetical protein Tco_1191238, partial [Tanacetum coccineum]